jgi:hypothetical protein
MLQVIIYYRKPTASLSQAYRKPIASLSQAYRRQSKGHTSNDEQYYYV